MYMILYRKKSTQTFLTSNDFYETCPFTQDVIDRRAVVPLQEAFRLGQGVATARRIKSGIALMQGASAFFQLARVTRSVVVGYCEIQAQQ